MYLDGAVQLLRDLRSHPGVVEAAHQVAQDPAFVTHTAKLENLPLAQSLLILQTIKMMCSAIEAKNERLWFESAGGVLALFDRFPMLLVKMAPSPNGPT